MAFLGNFLILAALHKVSSLHLLSNFLYRCLETTRRVHTKQRKYAYMHYVHCGQTSSPVVGAKIQTNSVYFIVATFWVPFGVAGLCYILDYRIDKWCDHIIIPSCLIISVASYTKIFCILRHHHEAHVQGLYNNSRSNQMH